MWKIRKFINFFILENCKASQILQFWKSTNFHYWQTHKIIIIKFLKLFNFENKQIFKLSKFDNSYNYQYFKDVKLGKL